LGYPICRRGPISECIRQGFGIEYGSGLADLGINRFNAYINYAWQHFGADRLMFGSDWPVANLAVSYMDVWSETNKAIAGYTEHERVAILGRTAAKFYVIQAE
jgi:predicted TIM-barrel fold metal-dependent hydrolase